MVLLGLSNRTLSWSGVVGILLPSIATNEPNMIRRVPVFGTKRIECSKIASEVLCK